jgi:SAM-dependent methyltransferase
MFESSKTRYLRGDGFSKKYFSKKSVLDIGSGGDLVCSWAIPFDLEDGDANNISHYFSPRSFDVVHSSHCLEHMFDPKKALIDWWGLVKPGGYLILVVPDESLYEQGIWPSAFNSDHKSRFTTKNSRSIEIINIKALIESLRDSKIISVEIQDMNYIYDLKFSSNKKYYSNKPMLFRFLLKGFYKSPNFIKLFLIPILKVYVKRGFVIDQTIGNALAQIQVIVKKISS